MARRGQLVGGDSVLLADPAYFAGSMPAQGTEVETTSHPKRRDEGQRFSGTLELAALLLCIAWRGKGKVLADSGDGYGNLLNLPLYLYSYRYGRISDKNL